MFKDDLINNIHKLYRQDPYVGEIFNSAGIDLDNLTVNIQDMLDQYDFDKMTWAIPIMETILKYKTGSVPIEEKRTQLAVRWKSFDVAKARLFKSIVKSWLRLDCDVSFADGHIKIVIISKNGFPATLENVYRAIEDVKPTHLPVDYSQFSITSSNIYYAATSISGETITVYPWTPKEIESRGTINLATASANNTETITVYPKEG